MELPGGDGGIREAGRLGFLWHPRCAFAARVLPLCGAAPTFLCSGSGKEK
jgi:hypothetical protein